VSGDGFRRGHQVARVLGIAIPLVMLVVWWGVHGRSSDVTAVTLVTAIVVKDEGRTCLVRVATGEEVRIFKPRNLRQGMTIRLSRTEHENGELRFDLIASTGQMP
jgi:hypothetical protein